MESKDKIERWIDQALRQHGNADAGPGFEARLLARVKERDEIVRARQRLWWAFGFAAVVTAVILAGLWLSYEPHPTTPVAHRQFEDGKDKSAAIPLQQEPSGTAPTGEASTQRRATARNRTLDKTLAREAPKLDQFPSPAPLSEQEQIMARYVGEHRQHAVMLARAETDLLERDRRERRAQDSSKQNISNEER